jgi:hypothetical protein
MHDRTTAVGGHVLGDGLGNEEEGSVEVQIRIVVLVRVFEEQGGLEIPGGIHQIFDMAVVMANECDQALHILWLIQVGLKGFYWTGRGEVALRLVELVRPMAHNHC